MRTVGSVTVRGRVLYSAWSLALLVAVCPQPSAQADFTLAEQKFLYDMAERGVVGLPNDQDLIAEGHRVCAMLRPGLPKSFVIDAVRSASLSTAGHFGNPPLTPDQALWLVNAAWVDLCPDVVIKEG